MFVLPTANYKNACSKCWNLGGSALTFNTESVSIIIFTPKEEMGPLKGKIMVFKVQIFASILEQN